MTYKTASDLGYKPGTIIALDFDDVLVHESIIEDVVREFGIETDDRSYGLKWMPEEAQAETRRRFDSPEYNRHPKIMPGAEEAVNQLASAGFHVVIVTARKESVRGVTEDVVSRFFPAVKYVKFTGAGPKGAICRDLGAKWLFDDAVHNVEDAIAAGVRGVLVSGHHTTWNHAHRDREDFKVIGHIGQALSVLVPG